MISIRITTNYETVPIIRQTPGQMGDWGNCRFTINQNAPEADWWVVGSGLRFPEECVCDPEHTIFVANEPPVVKYRPAFLAQFARVITCDRSVKHPGVVHGPYGLCWWAGLKMDVTRPHNFAPQARFGYDELATMTVPPKPKKMSVICSRLRNLEGHKRRVSFLHRLKAAAGNEIDFYGYDSSPLVDKWDGLAPYRYHLCIENTACDDYFTEKVTDPLLAFTLPLYCGCPNLADYLPGRSFIPIDINREDEAIAAISRILKEDPYQAHFNDVKAARRLVLDKYNFFAILADICQRPAARKKRVRIYPNHFPVWRRYASRAKRALKGALGR